MKAVRYSRYGTPDELSVDEVPVPEPRAGEVRLAVRAVSLNGSDMEFLTGRPAYARIMGLFSPRVSVLGSDVAGVIDAVGPGVTGWSVGQRVFADLFDRWGCLAEYVVAPTRELVRIPEGLDFVEAAALPQAGVLARQAVVDCFEVQPGQRGLIVGAGGGVGTYALQLAKHAGATVTAVDGPAKLALLEELGADRVVDYTREDVTRLGETYDFILDMPGKSSVIRTVRQLVRGGRYAIVGGHLSHVLGAVLLGPLYRLLADKRVGVLAWDKRTENLEAIAQAVLAGHCAPAIHGPFPLDEARAAFTVLCDGTAQGKVVVEV